MRSRASVPAVTELVALDFDGVISDSAPESFLVALLTYRELVSPNSCGGHLADVSTERAPGIDTIKRDSLYQQFVELMPLGNRAEDFGVALHALESSVPLPTQEQYDRWRATVDASWIQSFHTLFYQIRTTLSINDPEGWRCLMGPYQAFLDVLRRRSGEVILTIATAKDRRSVSALLEGYGIADLFSPDRVLDKETGVRKDAHLRTLRDRFGIPFDHMVFIDDKLNHLEIVSKLGVRCGLAAWGYNGAREAELARRAGFAVFELDNVERMLFG